MRGWTIPDQGGLAGLRLVELPQPLPAVGEAVVHLLADVPAAFARLAEGPMGKVVVQMPSPDRTAG
jgi:hypothetical protein